MKFREIAARLAEAAAAMPDLDADEIGTVSFRFGTLKITCRATADAVRAIAEKYRKGARCNFHGYGRCRTVFNPRKPSLKRPPDADMILAALAVELYDPETL
jgi:hypothetical protein